MTATNKIEMDLNWYTKQTIEVTQNDKNSRNVEMRLVTDGTPWKIPDDATAIIRYVKEDGTGGEYDVLPNGEKAWDASGSVLTIKLAPQVTTAIGTVRLSVTLSKDQQEISTFQIHINVRPNASAEFVDSADYYKNTWVEKSIDQLQADVASLQYDVIGPIDVTGISATPSVAELGSTVDSVTVTWAVNREPVSQTVAREAVDAGARSAVVPGPFTGTTSFEVVATDERGATDTATTRINFYNGIYYGPLASGVVPDSAAILGLTRKLQSGKGATISYTPTDGKRPSYACPTSYGTPKFVIGGFEYAWTKLGTIQFENASGHKETYGVWQHPQDVTAAMTITVS